MSVPVIGIKNLNPVTFQVITCSNSTAQSLNSTVRASANVLHLSVETNDVRYRADGTAPTLTTGVILQSDYDYWWWGYNQTTVLKFQRATGTSKVSVMAYKYAGQP